MSEQNWRDNEPLTKIIEVKPTEQDKEKATSIIMEAKELKFESSLTRQEKILINCVAAALADKEAETWVAAIKIANTCTQEHDHSPDELGESLNPAACVYFALEKRRMEKVDGHLRPQRSAPNANQERDPVVKRSIDFPLPQERQAVCSMCGRSAPWHEPVTSQDGQTVYPPDHLFVPQEALLGEEDQESRGDAGPSMDAVEAEKDSQTPDANHWLVMALQMYRAQHDFRRRQKYPDRVDDECPCGRCRW